ncbi:MAG TPA: hypothetical protein VEA69_25350 [Tepidisphaeraceae bacterium]|nr:hypothetical protein [Tepidisphaeraceae bacterium]
MPRSTRRMLLILALLAVALPAGAWSHKEHIQLTRLAAGRLMADPNTPADMKAWLKSVSPQVLTMDEERQYLMSARVGPFPRGVEGLPYWAVVPDLVAMTDGPGDSGRKIQPFDVPERMLHFVDCEYFNKDIERRRYRHDLSNKPKLYAFPTGLNDPHPDDKNYKPWAKAGMLPFRVEQCYAQLVENLRKKRLTDKPGQFPRDEHAARWAGYLAHYVQDNCQPHHSTEDYKSRAYFAEKRTAPNVHWDMEGRLVDDDNNDYPELRSEFWTVFAKALDEVKDPIDTIDLRTATVEVALVSYDALPTIGLAAMKAYEQGGTPDKPEGGVKGFDAGKFFHAKGKYLGRERTVLEIKAHQMAWSVKRVEKLWLRAWEEAKAPVVEP